MKNLIFALTMTMFLGFTANQTFAQKKGNEVVCYKSNMDCADCEKTITEYLKFEKGVKDLKVDHVTNTIMVEYKAGKNNSEGVAKAIVKKGYKADKISTEEYKKITGDKEHGHDHSHDSEVHKEEK
jgi:mercuric ion binding protein